MSSFRMSSHGCRDHSNEYSTDSSTKCNYDDYISYDHDYYEKAAGDSCSSDAATIQVSPLHDPKGFGDYRIKKHVYQFDNNDMYEGPIVDGLPHGHGVTRFHDGSTYVGYYNQGKREDADGELYYRSGRLQYQGGFLNDDRNGFGTFYWGMYS